MVDRIGGGARPTPGTAGVSSSTADAPLQTERAASTEASATQSSTQSAAPTAEGAPVRDRYDGVSGTASLPDAAAHTHPPIDADLSDEVSARRAAFHAGRGAVHSHAHHDAHYTSARGAEKPLVIEGTDAADVIQVRNGRGGGLDVSVNGKVQHVAKKDAERVHIRAKGGDDVVDVDERVRRSLRVEGGEGSDRIKGGSGDDVLIGGGSGSNVIEGRGGHDTVVGGLGDDELSGGAGRDIIKGLDGADALGGGEGDDYLDGGKGADDVRGGAGHDAVLGGDGDDKLHGDSQGEAGAGNDVLAGGRGKDRFDGGGGADRFYAERGDKGAVDKAEGDRSVLVDMAENDAGTRPGHRIKVEGPAEYVAQVESDLEAIRSTPIGKELLSKLDKEVGARGLPNVVIGVPGKNDGSAVTRSDKRTSSRDERGKPGAGSYVDIRFDPRETSTLGNREGWRHSPSSVTLLHELVHAYRKTTGDQVNGEMYQGGFVPNEERRTVGLKYRDGDLNEGAWVTPDDKLNENTFRRQLGLPLRDQY